MKERNRFGRDVPASLLLVLPVPFLSHDGEILLEKQAANGLDRWAENFDSVTVAAPTQFSANDSGTVWVKAEELAHTERIELNPLPAAHTLSAFLKCYSHMRADLGELIERHRYLCFAIYELLGDWPAVASLEAIRQQRAFSVWTDNVAHDFAALAFAGAPLARRLKGRVKSGAMKEYHKYIIRRADLGLFHGADCYDAYAEYSRNPFLVHDIHLKPSDQISAVDLQQKIERIRPDKPVRIAYAGRAIEIKGPIDWLNVLKALKVKGIPFEAAWYGDGPMLDEMRQTVGSLGLVDQVSFPGFVSDREELVSRLRESDVFLFCHKAPESPRCLIEALKNGLPLIGYGSAYPRDLTSKHGGGIYAEVGDVFGLTKIIADLVSDRENFVRQIERAAQSGSEFDDQSVFRHRSDLIKRFS